MMPLTPLNKTRLMLSALLIGFCLSAGQSAFSFAPETDLLKNKGFSPEVIKVTEQQRNRQEWKEASVPRLSPIEKFFHNVYYGEWTGSIDDFGSQVLREN